jgi:hypothetical protein
VRWIQLAQDRDWLQALVNAAMKYSGSGVTELVTIGPPAIYLFIYLSPTERSSQITGLRHEIQNMHALWRSFTFSIFFRN